MTTDLLRKVASGRHTAILRAYARHSFRGNTTLGLTNSFIAPTAFSQAVQSQEASLAAITASTALQLTRSFHNARHQATGAFESLHGQLRSISIYEPYLMREFARFSRHLLLNRSIARQYLYVYHRYLARANMPLQDLSHVWPIQRQSRLRKLVRKIALKSVGHSLNYSQWAKALRFPQWAKDELRTSPICSQSIFDCREIFQMLNRKPYIHHQVVEDAIKFAIISKRLREF